MSKKFLLISAIIIGQGSTASAQAPLSAIDWLSDTVTAPVVQKPAAPRINEPAVSYGAPVEDVSVAKIGATTLDSVGLLPISVTGLPRSFWGTTPSAELADIIRAMPTGALPALQQLLQMILLAELDAPINAANKNDLFLARIDKLLDLGNLEQAQALLERAGAHTPDLFRRWFDVALLTGTENKACQALRKKPDIAPTFPARVFCLARNGDWAAAAVILETAKVLGFVSQEEDALLARFLDPELFEGEPAPARPAQITPLVFRMFEAIGEAIPTTALPRAFAVADLRSNIGWKPQLEAAERLAKSGAIDENQLLGLYTERKAAASGGIWDRVKAVQEFDQAYADKDAKMVAKTLPKAWDEMKRAQLSPVFAEVYGSGLADMTLDHGTARLAFRIGLLSKDYEKVANDFKPVTIMETFLVALAKGDLNSVKAPNAKADTIRSAFLTRELPANYLRLLRNKNLGQAILEAIYSFPENGVGDLENARKSLILFRSVGMEDVARRAALQLMLLGNQG